MENAQGFLRAGPMIRLCDIETCNNQATFFDEWHVTAIEKAPPLEEQAAAGFRVLHGDRTFMSARVALCDEHSPAQEAQK